MSTTTHTIRMSPTVAIELLFQAVKYKNRKKILELISPEDKRRTPDWDNESDELYNEWAELEGKALEIVGQ